MTPSGTVLGFFSRREDAEEALALLRRQGFAQSSLISKQKVEPEENRQQSTLSGWIKKFKNSRCGVDKKTRQRYEKWTVRGETLVLAQTHSARLGKARELLREAGQRPATFVMRPQNVSLQNGEKPLRREAFTPERLREHAAKVAIKHAQRLGEGKGRRLLHRLQDNEKVIGEVCSDLAEAVRLEQPVSLASEWLIDNSYIIQSQILDVQEFLNIWGHNTYFNR